MATFFATVGTFLASPAGTATVAAASAAATGLSAYSQMQAGKAAAAEAEMAKEADRLKANEEAIGRRERLIQALAAQNARVGASGVAGDTGSPVQVKLTDIEEFEREDMARSTIDQIRQRNLAAAARNARRSGALGAGVSLLSGATDLYQTYGK